MIHFNEVKKKILEMISEIEDPLCKYYIIRDVFGRISIYVEGSIDIDDLEEKSIHEIGQEWVNVINSIDLNDFLYKDIVNCTEHVKNGIYYGERPLVKRTWRSSKKTDINIGSKVCTFYSYKGGVGRTTALVLTALQLVRQGKKVVIVDFDLEAPGVATLLKPENEGYYPKYGTIDFLIESANYVNYNKKIDIDEYIYPVSSKKLTGLSGGELFVMQATKTDVTDCNNYFEKLSRIDFGMPQYEKEGNPVELLLQEIDKRYKPDFILLDSRAGIHDIGGITLTKYTDDVVCLFYGNEQNMFGLNFVLPKVVKEEIPFYLINSPVPLSEEEAELERELYIKNSYNILRKCGYYDENNIPDIYDESSDHFPLDIKYNPEATIINSEARIDNLLKVEGSNNVYLKLAESLTSTNSYTQIINENVDHKIILEAINKIIPGETASAENELKSIEDLTKRFYPLKDHKYIFDNNKFLIIGPKGSGKTALFSVLEQPEYAKSLAKYLNIPMQDINKTEWMIGLGLGREFPNKDNFNSIGREKSIIVYRMYWQCLAIRALRKYIENYIENQSEVIKEIFQCKNSELKQIINKHENIGEIISDILNELDIKLSEADKVVIITYDNLDFALDREYRGVMIAALISFWFENMTRLGNIKSKIFLRKDIFEFEVKEGITDKVKLNNYTANLGWQYDYLLAMVWKRMIENNNSLVNLFNKVLSANGYNLPEAQGLIGFVPLPSEECNKIMLREIIGERMGTGKKAYTYNWIANRLGDTNKNIVPRSILKLFSISTRNEINDKNKIVNENTPILRPKSLENSLKEVSIDRLSDLSEEYPEYKEIFYNLKNHCPSFPVNEDKIKKALPKCGIPKTNVITVIDELKSIGVFSEYQRKKSDPIRYHIPDIYLKGMGLSRKGYK